MRSHAPARALLVRALLATALLAARTAAQPFGTPSSPLVGIWNLQQGRGTVIYRPDGTTEIVARTSLPGYVDPVLVHMVGRYRLQPAGPGRYRVHLSVTGWAPSEICQAVNGQPTSSCRPMPNPGAADGSVAFLSRDAWRDETGMVYVRANGPGLLAQRVPVRLFLNVNAPPPGSGGGYATPNGGGYTTPKGGRYVSPVRPASPTDGNLQQQRICTVNDGHIVTHPDGRQECRAPY